VQAFHLQFIFKRGRIDKGTTLATPSIFYCIELVSVNSKEPQHDELDGQNRGEIPARLGLPEFRRLSEQYGFDVLHSIGT
jgi:hypothetical protein